MRIIWPLIAISAVVHCIGYFDSKELREVTYNAEISKNLFWFAPEFKIGQLNRENFDRNVEHLSKKMPEVDDVNYILITNKFGQDFICNIPQLKVEEEATSEVSQSKNPKFYSSIIAAAFYIDPCVLYEHGWWTYEVCFKIGVTQQHGLAGKADYISNSLGYHTGLFQMPNYTTSTTDRPLYVEEIYEGGTDCELNGGTVKRKTVVRYQCDLRLETHEAEIESVLEPAQCEYLILLRVGSLCSKPEFLSPNQKNLLKIRCHPYLNKALLKSYLRRELAKREKIVSNERRLIETNEKLRSVIRRRIALLRTERLGDKSPERFDIRRSVKMELFAAMYDNYVASYEFSTGFLPKQEAEEAIWTLINNVVFHDQFYHEAYMNLVDENAGNLWYYFKDPYWPKNQFPRDIISVLVRNHFFELSIDSLKDFAIEKDRVAQLRLVSKFNFEDLKDMAIIDTGTVVKQMARNLNVPWRHTMQRIMHDHDDYAREIHMRLSSFDSNRPNFNYLGIRWKFVEEVYNHKLDIISDASNLDNPKLYPFGGKVDLLMDDVVKMINKNIGKLNDRDFQSSFVYKYLKIGEIVKLIDDDPLEIAWVKDRQSSLDTLRQAFYTEIEPIYWMIFMVHSVQGNMKLAFSTEVMIANMGPNFHRMESDVLEFADFFAQTVLLVLEKNMEMINNGYEGPAPTLEQAKKHWIDYRRSQMIPFYSVSKGQEIEERKKMNWSFAFRAEMNAREVLWKKALSDVSKIIARKDSLYRKSAALLREKRSKAGTSSLADPDMLAFHLDPLTDTLVNLEDMFVGKKVLDYVDPNVPIFKKPEESYEALRKAGLIDYREPLKLVILESLVTGEVILEKGVEREEESKQIRMELPFMELQDNYSAEIYTKEELSAFSSPDSSEDVVEPETSPEINEPPTQETKSPTEKKEL
ncbi:unnamed protein product [Caenorhabditis auriculariae]|uniref:MRH domain-containing protein n=1 Tax=Caenorhabditis auriculariae TaxID=2777116 RepID=A0A8S1GWD0_9PELO|nr:unnamed protein product [Caenorhabditis auriculariae]